MRRFIFCLLCIGCLLPCLFGCRAADDGALLRIYFLDVGQGDSILLRSDGGDVLIDAGSEDSEALLCLRLEQLGVKELALAVFTHADEDHIGGADGVLTQFPAKEIWFGDLSTESEAIQRLLAVAEGSGTALHTVTSGEVYQIGSLSIGVLAPFRAPSMGGNENSTVLRVQCGKTVALFSGDVGIETEQELVKKYGTTQLSCDLYKVGHHGSDSSSDVLFLHAMRPDYAVISCGAGNPYGHPSGAALKRLEDVGAEILRTDLLGEIVFSTDGETLTLEAPRRLSE